MAPSLPLEDLQIESVVPEERTELGVEHLHDVGLGGAGGERAYQRVTVGPARQFVQRSPVDNCTEVRVHLLEKCELLRGRLPRRRHLVYDGTDQAAAVPDRHPDKGADSLWRTGPASVLQLRVQRMCDRRRSLAVVVREVRFDDPK